MKKSTSWGGVAKWYDELLEEREGTYQREVILPNLLRLLAIKKGEIVHDVACGQGFFARAFEKAGATVVASDISEELIARAKQKPVKRIAYHVAPADDCSFAKSGSVDKAVIVLAIQNIENMNGVLKEIARTLRTNGRLYIVLNHPCFRVPQESDWGYDDEQGIQYRRVDKYLSEAKIAIQMHPGDRPNEKTVSFHRPLQSYAKALGKAGFAMRRIEEWNSHKKSEPGPRAKAEDRARKEIPLFMMIEAEKMP